MNTKKKKGNGEGSVYKYKTGYRGQIVVGTDDDGKPIRRSVTGNTIKEVNEKLTAIKNSMLTGTYIAPNKITLGDLTRLMLEDDLNLNYIKESTYYRHLETLKRIEKDPYMKNTPLQELRYTPIKKFMLGEAKMSQSLIDKVYTMIQRTIKEAIKRKILTENPIDDLKKPKSSQTKIKVRALTTDEELKLYRLLTTEDVMYSHQMLLSMLTGMRMGEVNALMRSDINLRLKIISVNKTMARGKKGKVLLSETTKTENGERPITISNSVLPLIIEILSCCEGNEFLFTRKNKLITTSQVNMCFKRLLEKYDILDKSIKGKVSVHSLRHTFATRCIEAGMQPKVLQHLLGHSDIKITLNTYCDAFESFQSENLAKTDDYLEKIGISFNKAEPLRDAG